MSSTLAPYRKPVPSQYFTDASYAGLNPQEVAGLRAVGALAVVSATSTFSVVCFLIYRSIFWRKYYISPIIYNQNIVLLFNLFVSDLFQATGYSLSLHWLHVDGVFAPSPACTAQGIMINMGNVVSGSFVLLISLYTAISIFWGRVIPWKYLLPAMAFCWCFGTFVSTLGRAIYGLRYFTETGIWCWANENYEAARLWSHYIWIFLFEFCTLAIYITVFIYMRRRTRLSRPKDSYGNSTGTRNNTANRVNRATWYMVLYPLAYFICTAPLAIGRMYVMHTNKTNPPAFYILAGCTITSAGSLDCLIYALTRRVFVSDHNSTSSSTRAQDAARRADYSQQLDTMPRSRRSGAAWRASQESEETEEDWGKHGHDLPLPAMPGAPPTAVVVSGQKGFGHERAVVTESRSLDCIISSEENDVEQLIGVDVHGDVNQKKKRSSSGAAAAKAL